MCPSGTGRFIADSWFSDEPLPIAYTVRRRRRCARPAELAARALIAAVEKYLREVNLPAQFRSSQRG
jgi:hypothetical protein